MDVRKKLQLNTVASALTVLVVAFLLMLGLFRIEHAFRELDLADEILNGLFQRNTLLHDYVMTGNDRARRQWHAEHARVGKALKNASEEYEEPTDQRVVADMIKDHEATGKLFAGIVENSEKRKSAQIPADLSKAVENRHLTQVNIRLYGKILNIQELRGRAKSRVFIELKRTGGGLVVFIFLVAGLAALSSWTMSRNITRRISRLQEGASIIGGGDLEHRIDIHGHDELSGLSQAFNAMTEKLRISRRELQNEIAERKRTEASLQRLNETLEQRVSERTEMAETRSRQLRALAVELIEAEEQERRRIAQLLHDDLQQMLAAAKMQLQVVSESLPSVSMLGSILPILEESIAKSRRLSHELSPAVLHHSGLAAGLDWLCGQMNEQFGLKTVLRKQNDLPLGSPTLKAFLFRAVKELLFNVVKHSGAKEAVVDLAGSDHSLALTVSDKGQGFEPCVLDQAPGKVGFGLLTIRERAQHMGGKLSIQSAPGQGSRFTLTLPWALVNAQADTPRGDAASHFQPRHQAGAGCERSLRVLFVDDHQETRQGLVQLISHQPDILVVGQAANGREAVEQARRLRPDLIVMDIGMPEMDGLQATRLIKSEMPQIRVVGLSMHQDEDVASAMHQAGADCLVGKTASPAELLKAIYGARFCTEP